MSENLDAGDIISSFDIKIDPEDNKLTLEKKLTDICIEELPKILTLVESNKIELKEQNDSSASYCKKIVKSDSIIDFNEKAINIINKFRAYYEWPGLSFLYKDNIIKIHEIKEVGINSNNEPGTINKLSKDGLYLNTSDLVVVITYLQFPNKKIISSSDVYNSYRDFFQ
jgi:methionyl-tRNA formyltransferase